MEDMRGDFGQSTAPVKVGDELEVTIEAVGAKGDGIAKKEGFVLFVPNVQKGDRAKIRVTRVLSKAGFAEVVSKAEGGAAAQDDASEGQADGADEPEQEATPEPSEEDSEDFGDEEESDSAEDFDDSDPDRQ